MLNSVPSLLAPRKGFVGLLLIVVILAPALAIKTSAEDPPFYGQVIRTNYYQDETFTGIYVPCDFNTCTEEEVCLGPKTAFGVEVNRFSISCDDFFPPPSN